MGSINRGIVDGREKERAVSSFESYVGRDKISDFAGARP